MSGAPTKDNNIRIGDFVTLKFLKNQQYLTAEGILVEDLATSSSVKFFEEHLFQIYAQRQYSATNELEDFSKNYPDDFDIKAEDAGTQNHYEALVKGKENEINLNLNVMRSKTGNLLCFGDTVQLLHVKSKKFLQVKLNTARDERENMQVTLSSDGSVMSWIKIMPRYKINREGDLITNGTEVVLKISERANEFIHCADRKPPKGKLREVNSSLEQTPWRINVFQRCDETQDTTLLLAGQLVYIRDPESQSMLAPMVKPLNIRKRRQEQIAAGAGSLPATPQSRNGLDNQEPLSFNWSGGAKHLSHAAAVAVSDPADDVSESGMVSISSMDEYLIEHGEVVLLPMEEEDFSTDALWMMESKSITRGGSVRFRQEQIHFRHFNTGKYLTFVSKPDSNDEFLLVLANEPGEKTLFSVLEIHSTADLLRNGTAVQIRHPTTAVYLERGNFHTGQRVYTCCSTRKKQRAVNVIVNRYVQVEKFSMSKKRLNAGSEVLDIYFAQSVVSALARFIRHTALPIAPSNSSEHSIWPRIDAADRHLFSVIIARTSLFVRGYPILVDNTMLSTFKIEKYISLRRQNMFRQQGLFQDLLALLDILQPISDLVVSGAVSSSKGQRPGFVEAGRAAISECLHLVYDLIKGNLANQLYLADHLLVILAHVSSDRMAAKVAQELLSSNRELQETKVGRKEITVFAEKMREVPMNNMYLQLLQTCCSCMGEGVPKNQEIVKSVILEKYKDILMQLSVNYETDNSAATYWGVGTPAYDLYLRSAVQTYLQPDCPSPARAVRLCAEGMPLLALSWASNSSRFSAQKLFGKVQVPFGELFRADRNNLRSRGENKSAVTTISAAEYKRSVSDFFIGQLHLCAEMCLGRNYPVMNAIEEMYSYEVLVAILKTTYSESLKSAAASLLLSLYVDRDPQTVTQLPRLTRTWTEVASAASKDVMSVETARVNDFALLQFIISEHLRAVRGKHLATQSYNLLRLLQKLITFNFYGSTGKLRETIDLLVANLKRDDFDLDKSPEASGIFTSVMKIMNSGKTVTSRKSASLRRTVLSSKSLMSDPEVMAKAPSNIITEDSDRANSSFDASSFTMKGLSRKITAQITEINNGHFAIALLESIESIPGNVVMMMIVVLSMGFDAYVFMSGEYSLFMRLVDFFVLFVFAFELLLHVSLHAFVRRDLVSFFSDVYNLIDIVNLVLFGVVYVLNGVFFVQAIRLLRVFALGMLLQRSHQQYLDKQSQNNAAVVWVEPERYFQTSEFTLQSIIKIIQILVAIQRNIEDRYLTLFLRAFCDWNRDPKSSIAQVYDVYQRVLKDAGDLGVSNEECDAIYIDLLMYSHPALVQSTLNLLMIHHSSHRIFIENAAKLQLITTRGGEAQYAKMESIIGVLKKNADTHEIWGKLTTEPHREINAEMHTHLTVLMNDCKKRREILHFDEAEEPVVAIQNILRNLGCFDVCLKVIQLVSSIDHDDTLSECHQNTRALAKKCSALLYWFMLDNPANQALGFAHLQYFIKIIDENVDIHKAITATFRNNIELIEAVPKKHIADFVNLICSNGHFPQYLSLMNSIIAVGEKNVIANQYEVIRLMSSPENQKKVVLFFCSVKNPHYAQKVRQMGHYLEEKDLSVDDLPAELAYHLELMRLLSGCTIGRDGMTTIEAKVQSMFFFVDIIEAMLDPNCLLLARIRLGQYLYNAMIDVETTLPGFKDADCVWKLLMTFPDVFSFAKDDLRQIEKNGWDAPSSNRQKVEYVFVCAQIISGYFSMYFDHTIFKLDVGQVYGVERVVMKEVHANELIHSLFLRINAIYEMVSPLLAEEHHSILFAALEVLNEKSSAKIVAQIDRIHDEYMNLAKNDLVVDEEEALGKRFIEFAEAMKGDERVKTSVDKQVQEFISKLEEVPYKDNNETAAKVRFEPLIEKLILHVRRSIQVVLHGDESVKHMSVDATNTSIWLLRIFRTMLENRWGMTISERDGDGGEEEDAAVAELMGVFSSSGMTEMCLDLIAKGIELRLQAEAIKLLVAMLFKEGGALEIQKIVNAHLSQGGSEMFFANARHILHSLIAWHKWNGIVLIGGKDGEETGGGDGAAEPELPEEIILVRCLQLFSEGHFGPNQDIMREQPNNSVSINLLDDLVLYLQAVDNLKCRTSTAAELKIAATILEVIQGPCEGNQDYFALNTELIETLNRMIRQIPVNDCVEEEEIELKKTAIDIFQGLLEGQASKTAIYERMLSVIHIDVIHVLAQGATGGGSDGGAGDRKTEESEDALSLSTESLVLMQMLTDFRPSLKKELGMEDGGNGYGSSGDGAHQSGSGGGGSGTEAVVACVEVVWHGELQRRFFHVPDICFALAQSTKDNFIQTVNRTSPEDKLYGMLEASREMYREIVHQNTLKTYKVDKIFSRNNIVRVTWVSFYITVLLNVLFVFGYAACETVDGEKNCRSATIELHGSLVLPVQVLIVLLILLALCTLILYIVVGVPVNYRTYEERGLGFFYCVLYSALDPLVLYYSLYLVVAVGGFFYHALITLLTLDFISKSPTARGVLRAVYNPRKQIFMTLVLTFIIIYIFAMFMFFFFNSEVDFSDFENVATLENAFKFLVRWGLPYGSPQDFMEVTISTYRIVLDVAFFITMQIMLNIIKGITIDTFVDLRKSYEKRIEDTTEKCFICGIDKNTFNRTLDRNAFRNHIKYDQNLWSYVYFIIFIWEQSKDDDDGLETYVRRCIEDGDLIWFPMNKAVRLAEHQKKGDVNSLKYRFRHDVESMEDQINMRMNFFKDQLSRTINRVEKALEYEPEVDKAGRASRPSGNAAGGVGGGSRAGNKRGSVTSSSVGGGKGRGGEDVLLGSANKRSASATNLLRAQQGSQNSIPGSPRKLGETSFSSSTREKDPAAIAAARLMSPRATPPTGSASNSLTGSAAISTAAAAGGGGVASSVAGSGGNDRASLDLDKVMPFLSALDADQQSLLHVKVVSISGLPIPFRMHEHIAVRVITDLQRATIQPVSHRSSHATATEYTSATLTTESAATTATAGGAARDSEVVATARNLYSAGARRSSSGSSRPSSSNNSAGGASGARSAQRAVSPRASRSPSPPLPSSSSSTRRYHNPSSESLIRFDVVGEAPVLVHHGSLPSADLSKFVVKLQILYSVPSAGIADAAGAQPQQRYLGGLTISLVDLLTKADAGGVVEAEFKVRKQSLGFLGGLIDSEGKAGQGAAAQLSGTVVHFADEIESADSPSSFSCCATVSCIASPSILSEWADVSEFWKNFKTSRTVSDDSSLKG